MTADELRKEASKVDMSQSIQLNKCTFVDNPEKSFNSLLSFYEAQSTDRQRERYHSYYLRAKEILIFFVNNLSERK